jgi:NADH-quinone oxidoreductase subunit A
LEKAEGSMVLFGDIGSVFMMGLIGVVFTLPVVVIPKILGPNKPNPIKNSPFECGQVPVGAGKMHYMMQYYAYLLMFIVFDVMGMFLYAWAAAYKPLQLGISSSVTVSLFISVLLVPMGIAIYLAGRRNLW